jgi:RNA polymerase sigma-70 factor (ECF subfamily)
MTIQQPTQGRASQLSELTWAEEIEVMLGMAAGRPESVTAVYDRHFSGVYRWVYNQVGRDDETAKEIVQDVFMGALKSSKYFSGKSTIRTWLLSIANRKIADYYRKHKQRSQHEVAVDMETLPDLASGGDGPDQMQVTEDLKHFVRSLLDKLPLAYRQVLVSKYQEGMSTEDIAAVIQKSPKAVENLLRRARQSFEKVYLQAQKDRT